MNEPQLSLGNAPIVEAVLDIDCDLPPALEFQAIREQVSEAFSDRYPKFRQQIIQQHAFTATAEAAPEIKMSQGFGAMQFLAEDEKQLVQFRPNGFSFNRLAPYSTFDDYLSDIERSWNTFRELAKPKLVRKVGIRMINRILLLMADGKLNFSDYLQNPRACPRRATT